MMHNTRRYTSFLRENPYLGKITGKRRKIHYNSHVTKITRIVRQSLSVGLS